MDFPTSLVSLERKGGEGGRKSAPGGRTTEKKGRRVEGARTRERSRGKIDSLDDIEHGEKNGLSISILSHLHDVRLEDLDDLLPVLSSGGGEEVSNDEGSVSGVNDLRHELREAAKRGECRTEDQKGRSKRVEAKDELKERKTHSSNRSFLRCSLSARLAEMVT